MREGGRESSVFTELFFSRLVIGSIDSLGK